MGSTERGYQVHFLVRTSYHFLNFNPITFKIIFPYMETLYYYFNYLDFYRHLSIFVVINQFLKIFTSLEPFSPGLSSSWIMCTPSMIWLFTEFCTLVNSRGERVHYNIKILIFILFLIPLGINLPLCIN